MLTESERAVWKQRVDELEWKTTFLTRRLTSLFLLDPATKVAWSKIHVPSRLPPPEDLRGLHIDVVERKKNEYYVQTLEDEYYVKTSRLELLRQSRPIVNDLWYLLTDRGVNQRAIDELDAAIELCSDPKQIHDISEKLALRRAERDRINDKLRRVHKYIEENE